MISRFLSWYRFHRMKWSNPAYAETFELEREAKRKHKAHRPIEKTRRAIVCEMLREGNNGPR